MKDLFEFIKHYGFDLIVGPAGVFALMMFGLSLIPSLSFIPKLFLVFILTH